MLVKEPLLWDYLPDNTRRLLSNSAGPYLHDTLLPTTFEKLQKKGVLETINVQWKSI